MPSVLKTDNLTGSWVRIPPFPPNMEIEDEGDESPTCEVGGSEGRFRRSPQVKGVNMPFKSEKQRRYMWKFLPKLASKWSKKYGKKRKKRKNKK